MAADTVTFRLGGRIINGSHVFVIAEAGVNHQGDIERALDMVDVAAEAGADAIKFQTFEAAKLVSANAEKASYQSEHTGPGSQLDMLTALELTAADHLRLMTRCRDKGILFLSTPFEEDSADRLDQLGIEAFKIPSGEITNLPFLAHVARKMKPMIVSTGMSDIGEVAQAIDTIERTGNRELVLLHCVSQYPSDPAESNLRVMATLRDAFGYPVGYSDHTMGTAVSVAAAALGATVIEKHFTLDRDLPGPDHKASLEPPELTRMIADIRIATLALGKPRKRRQRSEENTADVARKSIVAAKSIAAGTRLERQHLAMKRPGTGIKPTMVDLLIGRTAARPIAADTLLQWSDLA